MFPRLVTIRSLYAVPNLVDSLVIDTVLSELACCCSCSKREDHALFVSSLSDEDIIIKAPEIIFSRSIAGKVS